MQVLRMLLLTIVFTFFTLSAVFAQDNTAKTDSLKPIQSRGWVWKTFPNIKDYSLDEGKIVYKITLNSLGEVTEIVLLESTVKKKTEAVYREGLAELKFKSVGPAVDSTSSATGTITFNVKVR